MRQHPCSSVFFWGFFVFRCPSREVFPLIETEHKAHLRRLKGEDTDFKTTTTIIIIFFFPYTMIINLYKDDNIIIDK